MSQCLLGKRLGKRLVHLQDVTTSGNSVSTVDCTAISSYQNLTVDNFFIKFNISGSTNRSCDYMAYGGCEISSTYDQATGKLDVTAWTYAGDTYGGKTYVGLTVKIYVVY